MDHITEKQWDLEAGYRGLEAGLRRLQLLDGGNTAARQVALSVTNGEKDGLLLEKSVMLKSESRLVSTGARAQCQHEVKPP